jgi:uncharacterized membrane protein YiaA
MARFQNKNPSLGKVFSVLQWKMLVYFMAIWYILWPFWYILCPFGIFFCVLVCCTKSNLATLVFGPFETSVSFRQPGLLLYGIIEPTKLFFSPSLGLPDGLFLNQNPNLGKFWRALELYILWPFGLFYVQLVYFMDIWFILWYVGIFFTILVCCTEKNLATLSLARDKTISKIPFGKLYNIYLLEMPLPIKRICQ